MCIFFLSMTPLQPVLQPTGTVIMTYEFRGYGA